MSHFYECPDCGPFKADDAYDCPSDPMTRICPHCSGHSGNIKYLGMKGSYINMISDTISPIVNHADGKTYDSKSAYYSALKKSGNVVVEPGMFPEKRETRGDFNPRKELKEVAQRMGLVG